MVDAYSLAFAGLLFIAGNLGDRYGRKGLLQLGLALFGAATLYAAFGADSSGQLIGARLVMGAAAAMVMPATLSIITNIFPREERARAVAAWAGISGAGTALGPLLSGWMLEHYSWHAVFVVNLPFILAALVLGYFLIPKLRSEHHAPLDVVGGLLSATGVATVVYTLIQAPTAGWLSPATMLFGLVGLALIGAFVAWELHTESPMLDVRLFKVPAFGVSSLSLVLVFLRPDGDVLLDEHAAAARVRLRTARGRRPPAADQRRHRRRLPRCRRGWPPASAPGRSSPPACSRSPPAS